MGMYIYIYIYIYIGEDGENQQAKQSVTNKILYFIFQMFTT